MRTTLAIVAIATMTVISGAGVARAQDFDLGRPGAYGVGTSDFQAVDPDRGDREIRIRTYYPAITDEEWPEPDAPQGVYWPERDAPPDATGVPYPVIVGDEDIGRVLGPHLASHGFVFAAVLGQHTWGTSLSPNMIDFPLDQMVALDALETLDAGPVAGMADTGRAGAIGYSFGGWDALMLTGARIDPGHYEQTCSSKPAAWSDNWWRYVCEGRWDRLVERATEVGIATPDGLWAPMGDERIKAAIPMGAEGFEMTGPTGLAEATAAVLLIGAGADNISDYDPATTELFAHYPGAELITFVDAGHMIDLRCGCRRADGPLRHRSLRVSPRRQGRLCPLPHPGVRRGRGSGA